ncbi:hypothetical protein LCGC14_2959770, partial [marine sediment metagenome]
MKHSILFSLMILLFSFFVAGISLPAIELERFTPLSTATVNTGTDNNFTTFAQANDTVFYINYTQLNISRDPGLTGILQVAYNDTVLTRTNYTLLDTTCGGAYTDRLVYKFITNQSGSRINSRHCFNISDWIELGSEGTGSEIFDARLFWSIPERTVDLEYTQLRPGPYSIHNLTTVDFNLTTINTLANENQTNWNCTLYTRDSRTANYTANGNA